MTGIAVVGTGFGCLTHVPALRAAGFDVIALVGRDAERTAQRAKRFDVPTPCTSLADALRLPGVDAVSVVTPPHTHAEIVLEAVAADRHVLCEKPFARDGAQGRTMLAAAEAAGVVHFVGHEFRYATGQALLSRTVASGAIGEPRLATFLLHIPLLADASAEVPDWWSVAEEGGGWLGAHATHVIDQVRTTLGEFAGLSASLLQLTDRAWTAEDTYVVHFRCRSGAAGVLQATAADRGPFLITSRIAGSAGTAWTEGDVVKVADANGTRDIAPPDDLAPVAPQAPPADLLVTAYDWLHSTGIDLAPYTRLAEAFRARVMGATPSTETPPPTFADGVAEMDVVDAIRIAARDGGWVTIA